MVAADIRNDGVVHLVAADPDRTGVNNAAERDHGYFGSTAADIDHHAAGRFGYRQTGTDRRSHRFFNQTDFDGARRFGRFLNSASFHRRGAGRNADDNHRRGKRTAVVHFTDKIFDHFFRDFKIGNNAVAQRTDRLDVAGGASQHLFCFVADRQNLFFAADFFNRHDRRLVQHNPLPFDIYQRIGGSQVNRHVGRE